MPELALLARLTVALVFVGAAAGKARDPGAFADAVENYELLPARAARPFASAVTAAEALVAAALLAGVAVRAALLVAAALLLVFAAASGSALVRRKRVECGCLGSTGRLRAGWATVGGNAALAAGAVAAATQPLVATVYPTASAGLGVRDMAVVAALALLLSSTYWLVLYAESVTARLTERYETGG